MARVQLLAAGLLAGTLACANDDPDPDPAPLAEVCGQRGPVRLLELAPHLHLDRSPAPFRVGERRYLRTTAAGGGHEAWSVGLCGEDPRRLATDVAWLSPLDDRWPGSVFACVETSDTIVLLDPAGGPPTPFLPGAGCSGRFTDHGVLTVDAEPDPSGVSALTLYPYPADPRDPPPPPLVLHEQIRLQPAMFDALVDESLLLAHRPDAVFALDLDDQVLRFDLKDGSSTVEATGVLAFAIDPTGRWLLSQATSTGSDSSLSQGLVVLHDREAGTSVALGEANLSHLGDPFLVLAHDLVALTLRSDDLGTRLFRLSDLFTTDVPPGLLVLRAIDSRRITAFSYRDGAVGILDIDLGSFTPLLPRPGDIFSVDSERMLVLARDRDDVLYSRSPPGPLYHVALDGSDTHVVAPKLGDAALTDDHHLVGIDHDDANRLVHVDLATTQERSIDTSVHSFQQGAGFGPGHVVYSIDDGARTGIYVAHLPPG